MIRNHFVSLILLTFLFLSFNSAKGQDLDSLQKKVELSDSLDKVNQKTIKHITEVFSKHKNSRPKIGLVLAGGGAKGFAHVGVLQLLDSLNIPVDYIAGNSMGGLIGALYAIGYSGKDLEVFSKSLDWNVLLNDNPPREELPFIEKEKMGKYQLKIGLRGYEPAIPSGLIYGQNIQMFFHKLTAPYESVDSFDDLPTPFRCVAVDLLSGEQVVLKDGSLAKAMRATMSIPSAFSPVEWDDYLLVDGLVLNNYPVDVVKNMGADIVIGLNLTTGKKDKGDFENLLTVFDRMLDIPTSARLKENIEMTDIYISQDMSGYSTSDFSPTKTDGIIQRGRNAGNNNTAVLLALKEQLEKYKDYNDWVQHGNRKKKEEIRTINDNYISSKIMLGSYEISGADNFSENFISHHLKLQVNDVFNNDILLENIEELYALNYFESISFQTRESGENKIHLIIEVKEKPLNRLVTGFRYDDYFKIVGLVGLETNSVLLSGTQFQTYLKFGGLTTLDFKFLYPSRSMDMPVYPFLSARYSDIPQDFYYEGKKIFRYRNRSWKAAGGLNFSLSNSWNLEASLDWEWMNIFTEIASQEIEDILSLYDLNARIVTGKIQLLYDSLDDIIIPNSGVYFKSYYERTIPTFGSVLDYNRVFGRFDAFLPLAKNHNLRLDGAYMKIWDKYDAPFYKWFYLGGPETFVGLDYYQAAGTEFTVAAMSYRYEFWESIYLKGTFNTIFNYTLLDGIKATKPLFGYGISALMKTILGKIEIMWARGDENVSDPGSKSNKVYFILGYHLR